MARASVHVPAGIHYPAWKGQADAGRSGSGELHVLVDDAGEVNGAITGALGELTVRGKVEENELRAGVRPAVDSSDAPMYGVLVGQRRGNHIEGHLQASSGDGEQVRQATLLLEPKNP